MKYPNFVDMDTDGHALHVNLNPSLLGRPLISITACAASFSFSHTLRPDQAREMGQFMIELANQLEAEMIAKQVIEMAVAA